MRRILLYTIAVLCLIGGIMGIIKAIVPQADWLSFRYLLGMGATYELQSYPIYARLYGAVMAIMEICISVILLLWRKKYFWFCIIVIIFNMIGCLIAIMTGDYFAIISLILRIIPVYLLIKEIQLNYNLS